MSVLELPRYLLLVLQGAYISKLGYSLHILGGIFFFAAFSIVCRQVHKDLQEFITSILHVFIYIFTY